MLPVEYNIDAEGNYDFTGEFNWRVFVSLMVMWVFIFFAIFKGVDSTGWVVKFTVPFPLLILIVLIIRGRQQPSLATLPSNPP